MIGEPGQPDVEDVEIVDALPVLTDERQLQPVQPPPRPVIAATPALAQTAAVAATGFVAGAATAVVFGRHLGRRLARVGATPQVPRLRSGATSDLVEVVATRSFLVNVHLLGRRGD